MLLPSCQEQLAHLQLLIAERNLVRLELGKDDALLPGMEEDQIGPSRGKVPAGGSAPAAVAVLQRFHVHTAPAQQVRHAAAIAARQEVLIGAHLTQDGT